MKIRKRTSVSVPAKGRLRDFADRLWSRAVRDDWANHCAVCGSTNVEAHHLVPRQHEQTRYDLKNGVALCAACHQFDKNISPHQNSAGWISFLIDNHHDRFDWFMDNRRPIFTGKKNADYYIATIRRLQPYVEPEEFTSIVGVRFAAWLEETREE
jgi:hypothetical protein